MSERSERTENRLERRYRRLLAVYPWEHRRAYEEEMLAVLLAGARPGQTRPDGGDAVNLIAAGLRARVRVGVRGLTEPAWADAGAVTGVLVALVLCAAAGSSLLDQVLRDPSLPPPVQPVGPDLVDWLRLVGWAAVTVTALAGLRWVSAGLAWAGVAGWVALVAPGVVDQPTYVIDTLPQFAFAVVGAAALTLPASPRRTTAVLGAWRLAAMVAGPAVAVALLALNRITRPPFDRTDGTVTYRSFHGLEAASESAIWLYLAGLAGAALAVLVGLATLAPPVRRRVVVLLAPVGALALAIDTALAGWAASTVHMGHAIPLVPAQWAMLVLVPLVTFLAGVMLVRRREETLRMVALGRAADRQGPTA
ncbi:hypothetical protein ONA70_18110 [Micromonospora yasonensis]|uniref:hypothetical protein n=1 Tax=Micromonospora yasonensis TaxID=1128667 RepID=UPI00222E95C3|nr:hypothetical protein [Micromonospora yasonensis]MCW3842017.1 hypothetical protein [Micromonospora yasonensis]